MKYCQELDAREIGFMQVILKYRYVGSVCYAVLVTVGAHTLLDIKLRKPLVYLPSETKRIITYIP